LGVTVALSNADLGSEAGVASGIEEVLAPFGRTLDVLVNNVGAGAVRTFDQLSDADWDATMNLNFMSYVRAVRVVLPILRERGGAIVNNASDLARQPERACRLFRFQGGRTCSDQSPGARRRPKDQGQRRCARSGWTPFWTKSGGFAETLGAYHKMPPQKAVEHEMSLRQLPMGRLGQPEEVANVIVFLASDLAGFVTSSVWGVDGGSIRSII
jgi:NAD(P)-dependent dehydrogenase (short-subunit alcohol dehydrogenase family)